MQGISFGGLLTIVFIALKLTNFIDWSWVWVLAPLWIGFALSVILIIFMFIVAGMTGGKVVVRKNKS